MKARWYAFRIACGTEAESAVGVGPSLQPWRNGWLADTDLPCAEWVSTVLPLLNDSVPPGSGPAQEAWRIAPACGLFEQVKSDASFALDPPYD